MQNKEFMRNLYKTYGQDKVLLLGFYIAKEFHYVGISNGFGDILENPFEIGIYEEDYEKLVSRIKHVRAKESAEVMVFGCEPSGN